MKNIARNKVFEARPFKPKDARLIASWVSSSPMDLFLFSSSLNFPLATKTLVKRFKEADPKIHRFYSVFFSKTNGLAGYFEIKGINKKHRIGTGSNIILSPEYRKKGYGKELVDLLTKIAFLKIGLYRISLSVHTINKPAIKAYLRAGYSKEGLIKEVLNFGGKRHSLYQMSMLLPEWKSRKRGFL